MAHTTLVKSRLSAGYNQFSFRESIVTDISAISSRGAGFCKTIAKHHEADPWDDDIQDADPGVVFHAGRIDEFPVPAKGSATVGRSMAIRTMTRPRSRSTERILADAGGCEGGTPGKGVCG
jgi:hypothetical protein